MDGRGVALANYFGEMAMHLAGCAHSAADSAELSPAVVLVAIALAS